MEVTAILELLSNLPWWFWIFLLFTFMWFGHDRSGLESGGKGFGSNRSIWEYEVKFSFKEGIGKGEIEFEYSNKKGMSVECDFDLEEQYYDKPLEIFLSGRNIISIPAEENLEGRIRFEKPISIEKPSAGDSVTVRIENVEVFKGSLKLD